MKKKIILILVVLFYSLSIHSQNRDYFQHNILYLDPIEGIYDVDAYMQGANNYQTFPETYKGSLKYTIVRIDENKFSVNNRDDCYIERIGETNAYNYWEKWNAAGWVKIRFYLLDSCRTFELKGEVPEAQLRSDLGRNYQKGSRLMFRYTCIKEYPTTSMYLEAAEEAMRIEQEAQKPTEWSGTGFALNNGYIVTNYHVVEDANSIVIKGIKGDFNKIYSAEVVASDKYNDLALLKISDSNFSGYGTIPYKIKTKTSDVGEDVFVLGYPLTSTMGDEIKLTNGIISSKTGFQGDVSLYQISAPIQPGNSGGPLFDSNGNIIGIVNAKHNEAENVGYAIKSSYLINLIESSATSSIVPTNNTISGLPLTGKVKSVKDFVFMIRCSSKYDSYGTNTAKEIHDDSKPSSNDEVLYFDDISIETNQFIWELIKIKLTSNNTIITKRVIPKISSAWVNSSKNEFIEDVKTGKRYYITGSSIGFSPEKTTIGSSITTFAETYPALPDNVTVINISSGSSYYIKNYKIR